MKRVSSRCRTVFFNPPELCFGANGISQYLVSCRGVAASRFGGEQRVESQFGPAHYCGGALGTAAGIATAVAIDGNFCQKRIQRIDRGDQYGDGVCSDTT